MKSDLAGKAKGKHSQSKGNFLNSNLVSDLEKNNLSDFLLTKSSIHSTLGKKGLTKKKSGVIKSSLFGKGKSKKRKKKSDLNSSIKLKNSKNLKVQNSNPVLLDSGKRKKQSLLGKSKKTDKISSRASFAQEKTSKARKKVQFIKPKKHSLFAPVRKSIGIEKQKFMNTTDFAGSKTNLNQDPENPQNPQRINSYNNFHSDVKIRKKQFSQIKKEITKTSIEKIPKNKKTQKSNKVVERKKNTQSKANLSALELKELSKKQRNLSIRKKLKQISNIKKTGSAFKESFSKKYYIKQSENRSNQVSQRKLTSNGSLDQLTQKDSRKGRRENQLVDYLSKVDSSEKGMIRSQLQEVTQSTDFRDALGGRKQKIKERNLFSFSENQQSLKNQLCLKNEDSESETGNLEGAYGD